MPPTFCASESTFDFSSPEGCSVPSMKTSDAGGAKLAGSLLEELAAAASGEDEGCGQEGREGWEERGGS